MSAPRVSYLLSDSNSLSNAGNALVWSRAGSGANLVIMTENEIAVGALRKSELHTIEQRLENGESVLDAIGEKGKLIHFNSIESITADLSNKELNVVFKIRGRTKTVKLRFSDSLAQLDALREAQSRMRGKTRLFETTSSRLSHIMKPLNFVVLFGMLTTLTHFYFERDPFEAEANRKKFEEYRKQSERHRSSLPGRSIEKPLAPRYEPSHELSKNPTLDKLLRFGYLVLGSFTMILSNLGYTAAISTLLFLTTISLFYLFYRLTHPPRMLVLAR